MLQTRFHTAIQTKAGHRRISPPPRHENDKQHA